MNVKMFPQQCVAMKRTKSWKREHQETHFRRMRYVREKSEMKIDTLDSSADTSMCNDTNFFERNAPLGPDTNPLNYPSQKLENATNYRTRSHVTNVEIERGIAASMKAKLGHNNHSNQSHISNSVENVPSETVRLQILKRPSSSTEVHHFLKAKNCVSEAVRESPKVCSKNRPYTGMDNGLINHFEANTVPISSTHKPMASIPLPDLLRRISIHSVSATKGESQNHTSTEDDVSCDEVSLASDTKEETGLPPVKETILAISNEDSDEVVWLNFGCNIPWLHVLDENILGKIHGSNTVGNVGHNCGYAISPDCATVKNCDCLHKYLLNNGLIGYVANSSGQIKVLLAPYKKIIMNEKLVPESKDQDEETIILFFSQVRQKSILKSKLRSINQIAACQRPDDRHFSKLDSSLKKNTAFVKRLKIFTGNQLERLLEDMAGLNLTKYISEIAAALVECKLKMSDVWAAVQICNAFHQTYSEFSTYLLENWHKALSVKKDEPICNAAKLRVDLRFYAELIVVGIFSRREGLPLLGNVLTLLTYLDKDDHYNIKIILSFCRHCGNEYAGLVPRKVRELSVKYNILVPQSDFLSEGKMKSVRSLIKDYYDSLYRHVIKEYRILQDIIKQNKRILQTRGELCAERKEKLEVLQISLKRILDCAVQLADILDEDMPQLPSESSFEDDGIPLCDAKDLGEGGLNSVWDDEETRIFYERLPDMKQLAPGLQGTTCDQSESQSELKKPNAQKEETALDDTTGSGKVNNDEDSKLSEMGDGDRVEVEEEEEEEEEEIDDDVDGNDKVLEEEDFDEEDNYENDDNDDDEEEESEPIMNINGRILMDSFLSNLTNCVTQEMIDKASIEFVKNLNTKPNRRRLVKALFMVPRTRTDLLPFYARFVATINPVIPDVATELAQMLKQEFRYLVRKKDQLNIESKIKVVRFIGELVKFYMYNKCEAIYCLKILVQDFSHHHIDMCCSLLECCGKFLSQHPESHFRVHHYLEQIMRKKTVIALDPRYITMIENAYYQVIPPETTPAIQKERPALHEFIRNLVYQVLSRTNIDDVLNLMLILDWDDFNIASYAVKCLTNAYKVKYFNISCLASLTAGIAVQQEMEGIQVVDAVLEDIQLGMELNLLQHHQRRLAMIKYLGELYNYRMVENTNIFQALYSLITFGVTWDYDIYSPLDPPESVFRVRLVCTLLHTCGEYFSSGSSKRKLDVFLVYFQYYFWFKFSHPHWQLEVSFPYDVKYMFQDTLKYLRPKLHLFTSLEEAHDALKKLCMEFEAADFQHLESDTWSKLNFSESDLPQRNEQVHADDSILNEKTLSEDSDGDEYFDEEKIDCLLNESTLALDKDTNEMEINDFDSQNNESEYKIDPRVDIDECQEDREFLNAFDRMVSENMQNRMHETVKPQQLDISVPLCIGSCAKKSYEQLKMEDSIESVVNFVLMLRKGHKALYKKVAVPINSEMALNLKSHEEAERAEKEHVKRLTLNINERLEEEDYQETLTQIQKSLIGNVNRERRHRYHHPKGAPDADLIFSSARRVR